MQKNKLQKLVMIIEKSILMLLLVILSSHTIVGQIQGTAPEAPLQGNLNTIDEYFQKMEIFPTSGLYSNNGKILLRLKEEKRSEIGHITLSYGPEFDRRNAQINLSSDIVEIPELGYNDYTFDLIDKNGQKITAATFNLPVHSNHTVFDGGTTYFKPYQSYISSGQLVVHNYTENNRIARSRSSQTCNLSGSILDGGHWYKYSYDNYPSGGGGEFFYLDQNCAKTPTYGLNCTYSPGNVGELYNSTAPTQWRQEDPYVAFGEETTQKLAYIHEYFGSPNNVGEDLMHCVVEGTQCNNWMTQVNLNYQSVTIDGNITTNIVGNGEIEINTNADWVYLQSGHNLSVCGGTSASIDGDILKISGSGQRTVRLCTSSSSFNYNFRVQTIDKSDLLYLVPTNQVRQYFFGAKVRSTYQDLSATRDIWSSASCSVSITTQPENQTVCSGSTDMSTFCVEASGSGLSYQWQFSYDGTTLAGDAQESTSRQRCMQANNGGVYFRARVTDQNGCTTYSNWVKRISSDGPSITLQPENQAVCSGSTDMSTFCVEASGSGLTYQWDFSYDGTTLAGNAQESTSGQRCMEANNGGVYFRARVTDQNGCITYSNWVKRITANGPSITSQPQNQTACAGEEARFCVAASGGSLSYQWQWSSDGISVAGDAGEPGNNTNCLTATNSNVYFRVKVQNNDGCETFSNWVKINITDTGSNACTATINGSNTICQGGSTTLTASGGTSYLWSNGSTSPSITVSPTTTQTYSVEVTSTANCGSTCTESMTVNIGNGLSPSCEYRLQKQVDWKMGECNPTICADGRLELSVSPNNLASYQWSGPNGFSGTGNANGDILVSNCLMPNQAGTYTVTVTDDNGCTGTQSITIATQECPCNLNATISNETYLDNGTTNTAQHTFTYQVDINGSNAGGWLLYDVVNGNLNQIINTGSNGETLNMGPFPVDQNGSLLILMDADNTACIQSLGVNMNSCVYTGECACCK